MSGEDIADGFKVSLEVVGVGQVLEREVEKLLLAEAQQLRQGVVVLRVSRRVARMPVISSLVRISVEVTSMGILAPLFLRSTQS